MDMSDTTVVAQANGEFQSFSDVLQVRRAERLLYKARCYSLHGRVSMGNRGSIVSEQELHDQFLVGLCVGLR